MAVIIDDVEIATLASELEEELLKDDCQISRKASGCTTYTNEGSPVKCCVQDSSRGGAQESIQENRLDRSLTKDILLPRGTTIFINDHLTVNGITYRVVWAYKVTYDILLRVAVEQRS